MGNGNQPFQPTARQADDVLIQLVYADSTVDEVATSKGVTVDQLTEWLARPEIVALRARIESAATSHTRYSAIVNSPRQVRLLVDSCFEIHSEIHDAAQGRRPPRSSTQILKTVDKVLQICREMQYLTGFTPGDTPPPPPRRVPKPRSTSTAPNRGTDTALSVRGGPSATSATKFDTPSHERDTPSTVVQALQAHNRTTAPYEIATPHNPTAPSTPKCHDCAVLGTVVQAHDIHNPTPAPVQQQQQPEPQFVSPSIAAAATPPQPPAATSPPAPISNCLSACACLPACETGERWLPDAQRLAAASSDSPPMKWAVEPPPAPTASSSKSPPRAAPPPTAPPTNHPPAPEESSHNHRRLLNSAAPFNRISEENPEPTAPEPFS